jgi:hypothetical protein
LAILCSAALLTFSVSMARAADLWRLQPSLYKCPIQRLDKEARVPTTALLPAASEIAIRPPATEAVPSLMSDLPTRAGFAGPGRFVCCYQGAADWETCEVTPLDTGVTTSFQLDPDAPAPDWLDGLGDSPVWPFPDLEVRWTEKLGDVGDPAVESRARLAHPASGASVELDAVVAPEAGALRLWGVRTAPDAARVALVRHFYLGENTDLYPVTIFAAVGPIRALYSRVVELGGQGADDAALMLRALADPSSKSTD